MGGEKEERGFSDREKAEERERERKEEVGKQWMSGLMYSYDMYFEILTLKTIS